MMLKVNRMIVAKDRKKRSIYLSLQGNERRDLYLYYYREGIFDIDFFMDSTLNEIFYRLEESIEECSYKEFEKLSDCRIKEFLNLNSNFEIIYDEYLRNANLYKDRIKNVFNTMKKNSDFNMEIPWYNKG
ncbi:MAG: hypothetical protein ACOC5T_01020 [Elusimicrobiota bacterium]